MPYKSLGILHPGQMGVSIAASAKDSGMEVYWLPEGRSEATRQRATEHEFSSASNLTELCKICDIIVSVCPPHGAIQLAKDVVNAKFKGTYLDANAIAPHTAQEIAAILSPAGINFIDGGIIGGPAWKPNSTWLYLSGKNAESILPCFAEGPLCVECVSEDIGQASALKMAYAGFTKGSTALLCAVMAVAKGHGVLDSLMNHWGKENESTPEANANRISRVTAKAWRFSGEMKEIAATFEAVGIPGEFHNAAAELYDRIAHFKDADTTPAHDEVIAALLKNDTPS